MYRQRTDVNTIADEVVRAVAALEGIKSISGELKKSLDRVSFTLRLRSLLT